MMPPAFRLISRCAPQVSPWPNRHGQDGCDDQLVDDHPRAGQVLLTCVREGGPELVLCAPRGDETGPPDPAVTAVNMPLGYGGPPRQSDAAPVRRAPQGPGCPGRCASRGRSVRFRLAGVCTRLPSPKHRDTRRRCSAPSSRWARRCGPADPRCRDHLAARGGAAGRGWRTPMARRCLSHRERDEPHARCP